MDSLSRRFKEEKGVDTWGFIALLDVEAQAMSVDRLDSFYKRFQFVLSHEMTNSFAYSKLLNRTWTLFLFNGPATAYANLAPDADTPSSGGPFPLC